MLRFLKRPEVVYFLVVAAFSVGLCLLGSPLSAYFLFFFVYAPFYKAPFLLIPFLAFPFAAYLFGGPGVRNAAKWISLTVGGAVFGIGGIVLFSLAPNWAERHLTWSTAYTYRLIVEVDTADGPKSMDRLLTIEKKTSTLTGQATGWMGVRGVYVPGGFDVAKGITVGIPSHTTSVFNHLYTDTLRRLNLPLDGQYKGRRLAVDKELFPRITANHLKYYDETILSQYRDALARGSYRIFVELVSGTPQVARLSDQVCEYLLTLEVRTPDGLKKCETAVRVLREVQAVQSGKRYVRMHPQSGFLRIALADDLDIQLRFLPQELVSLPQRFLKIEDRERLRAGDRVEVPHALIDEQHFGGPQLNGRGVPFALKKYRPLLEGKAEYVLHFEMLDGTVARNTDWNDPDWSPSDPGEKS
jgi:hypothetical protein